MAYTHGNHVVFGKDNYQPHDTPGKRLLAHELTHVIQQNGMLNRKPIFGGLCKDYHRCNVIEPMKVAFKMIDKAISVIKPISSGKQKSGPNVEMLNLHFKQGAITDAGKIIENYNEIKNEMNEAITYNCYKDDPPECTAKQRTGAFTDCDKGAAIHLCNLYHVSGCMERARQLIHENVHHLHFCTDPAYGDSPAYSVMSHNDAMVNADSYARFAREIVGSKESCIDCSYAISKGKKY